MHLHQSFFEHDYMLPDEPLRFNEAALDRMLLHASRLGASDVTIQTGHNVMMELHGDLYRITRRELDNMELSTIVNVLAGDGSSAHIKQGTAVDPSYEIRPSRSERYRFRVNATACYAGLEDGIQITIRVIASEPPLLGTMDVETAVLSACRPDNGMVVISGQTGSGKSTLMSAILRDIAEDPEVCKKIVTYEAPIEYVFDTIVSRSSICQTELPRHIRGGFDEAVPNVLRRATDIVLVGESRNIETIRSAISASDSGQAVYTTFHAGTVTETVYRMINMFPQEERSAKMFELIEAMRLIVNQRLVKRPDGKRTALREFLVFDYETRKQLRQCETVRAMALKMGELIHTRGQSYQMAARRAFAKGLIDARVAESYENMGQFITATENKEES